MLGKIDHHIRVGWKKENKLFVNLKGNHWFNWDGKRTYCMWGKEALSHQAD